MKFHSMKLRSKLTLISVFFTLLTLSLCLLLVLHLVTNSLRRTDEKNLREALHMCSTNLLSAVNTSPASWRNTTLRSVVDYQFSLYARLLQDEKTCYSLVGDSATSDVASDLPGSASSDTASDLPDSASSDTAPALPDSDTSDIKTAPTSPDSDWQYLYNLSPYQPIKLLPPETVSSQLAASLTSETATAEPDQNEITSTILRRFSPQALSELLPTDSFSTAKAVPLLIGATCFSVSDQDFYLYISMDISDTQTQIAELRLTLFLLLAAASISLAFVLILLIRRALYPVELLNQQAQAIAAGDYSRRTALSPTSRNTAPANEILQLSHSFDQMADSIERTIHALDTRIERQQLLLAALTHELKTPMTAIIGYSDSLLHMPLSEAQRERCIRNIHEAGKRTEALSQKMMELIGLTEDSRIEKVSFPTEELLRTLREEFPASVSFDCSLSTLYGDPVLLHSLIRNLIENAEKAYDKDSSSPDEIEFPIQVNIFPFEYSEHSQTASFAVITVSDQGRGIPPEQLALVTEPFYRVDKARSRKQGGAGLGLALCSLIARRHGGDLEIESELGVGTVVKVTIRLD